MNKFRLIEMTNSSIGSVAVGKNIPLGRIDRLIDERTPNFSAFNPSTSGADTIQVELPGFWMVNYSISFVAAGGGILTLTLMCNDTTPLYTVSQSVTSGATVNMTLPKEIRTLPNTASTCGNVPVNLSIQLGGVAITSGVSNIIVSGKAM